MKILFVLSLVLFSIHGYAGHDQGGGGMGYPVGNKIYLFDFVEAGIEENPWVGPTCEDKIGATPVVRDNLNVSQQTQNIILNKFCDIYKFSPTVALELLAKIKLYQWRYTLPKVKGTGDVGKTPIVTSLEQKQIAWRDDEQKIATIDREYFGLMPPVHQAGLVFHELIYALENDFDNKTRKSSYERNSYKSRILNSYFFHPSTPAQTFEQFRERIALFDNDWKVVTKEAYEFLNSPKFATECETLKSTTAKQIEYNLNIFNAFWSQYKIELYKKSESQNCKLEYPWEHLRGQSINLGGKLYIRPVKNSDIYKIIDCNKKKNGDEIKVFTYVMPQKTINDLENIIGASKKLTDLEVSKFNESCLDPEARLIIKGFASINFQ